MRICNKIQKMELVINGHIDDKCISFCCNDNKTKPAIAISNSAEETANSIKNFFDFYYDNGISTNECTGCNEITEGNWDGKNKTINFVNLSIYPSPCQCSCSYCEMSKMNKYMHFDKSIHFKKYETIFEALKLLEKEKFISNDAFWQISTGEISIHPLKETILNLVKNKEVVIYSNCFIYDKSIADVLKSNKHSYLNFSIDAGCSETWRTIKGVNNFEIVIDNLKKYINDSMASRIKLKYILLEGINDDKDNLNGIINILQNLSINNLILSRNYDLEFGEQEKEMAKEISNLFEKNDIKCDCSAYK